jgi:hypothetical protein
VRKDEKDRRRDSLEGIEKKSQRAGGGLHPPAFTFFQLFLSPFLAIHSLVLHLLQEPPVDIVDDLHVPREQLLHQAHGPPLQGLGHNLWMRLYRYTHIEDGVDKRNDAEDKGREKIILCSGGKGVGERE